MQQRANEKFISSLLLSGRIQKIPPPQKSFFWLIGHLGVKFDECSTQCCQCQHWCLDEAHSFIHNNSRTPIHQQQSTSTTTTLELERFICGFWWSCCDWIVVLRGGKTQLLFQIMMEWCQIFFSRAVSLPMLETNCPIFKHVLNGFYYWQFFTLINRAVCMPLCARHAKQPVGLAPFLALVQVLWVKYLCKVWVMHVLFVAFCLFNFPPK